MKIGKHIKEKLKKVTDKNERDWILDEYFATKWVKTGEESHEEQKKYSINTSPDKKNRENLWDKSEKFDLNDLNLNLLPDDAESLLKQKRHLKWDAKKKKYVEMTVDWDGHSHWIRNESG